MAFSADQLVAVLQANAGPLSVALLALVVLPVILRMLGGSSDAKPKPWLNPMEFQALPLAKKEHITHNTVRLRFDLPDPKQRLGLPIGQHITFSAKGADGKDIMRSYTPVSDDDQLGSVEFVIKLYPTGKMSQVLAALEVGQPMLMRGPKGRMKYVPNMKKQIGMLAGGTGVTPMYQVASAIMKNPKDKTQVSLVFGNLTEQDILLQSELNELITNHASQFKLFHVLNTPPAGWTQGAGFITADIIKAQLPPPGPNTMVLLCGPPPMIDAMKKHLEALGYDHESVFAF